METNNKLRLLSGLNKWTMAIFAFALVYGVILTINLGNVPIRWDEINHLNGALLLVRGQIWDYLAINSYYPPLYNLVTATYFSVAGASVLTARLVTLTFSVLAVILVFKLAKELYSEKTGLVAAILFAIMPGIIWLSRTAMIDVMLIFVLSFCLLFFFRWINTNKKSDLSISLVALILGTLVKYQVLVVAPLIMLLSMFALGKNRGRRPKIRKILQSRWLWLGLVITLILSLFLYAYAASGLLDEWLYVIQFGNVGQVEYSTRFPTPVFYLIEMVWPYNDMHPISVLLYGLGLAGLGLFALRRKPQDKLFLIWFFIIYLVFTLISNRQWRYATLLFPVLAISAAELAGTVYAKASTIWKSTKASLTKSRLAKLGAGLMIAFTMTGIFYSIADANIWLVKDSQIQVPADEAVAYIASKPYVNGSILLLCPFDRFNKDMVWFYLNSKNTSQTQVYQYPKLAVDAYPPDFDITDLVNFCKTNGTKYVLLYEYEGTPTYYGSSLNEQAIYGMLNSTGMFKLEAYFGTAPRRMFVFSFAD